MTNDDGRKPEGAPERSPRVGAGAPSGLTGMARSVFPYSADGDCRATVARRATGTGDPRDECLDRQVKPVRERALAGAATALKEHERDVRDDEIARLKSKVGEITMDNELSTPDRGDGGQAPFGPQEVETMSQALRPPLFAVTVWREFTRVEDLARQRLSSLKETPPNTITVALVGSAHVRMRNWQIIFAGK